MAPCPSAVFHKERQYADEERLFAGQGFGICEAAFEYQPRHPEESILYRVVAENLESFLARQEERGRVVPRFVERDLRAFSLRLRPSAAISIIIRACLCFATHRLLSSNPIFPESLSSASYWMG